MLVLFISGIVCCTPEKKSAEESSSYNQNDTMELIRGFIYGLWSMDSGNSLNNEGFYFKTDGTVDFVGSDISGEWELKSKDSIKVSYSYFRSDFKLYYKIDSLNNNRMIIHDSDGTYLFRRVPFGINNEGNVLQGFAGSLSPGDEKEYMLNLPSTKKIALKLSSTDSTITFRLFDGGNELTSAPLHAWTGIIIRSGKYRAVVSKMKNSPIKGEGKFDLKVIVF
jgi:hypothetical protein